MKVLGFNVVQNIARLGVYRLCSVMLLQMTRMIYFRSSESPRIRVMRLK